MTTRTISHNFSICLLDLLKQAMDVLLCSLQQRITTPSLFLVQSYQHSRQIYHKYFNDAYIKKLHISIPRKLFHTFFWRLGLPVLSLRSFEKRLCFTDLLITRIALKQIVKFTLSKRYRQNYNNISDNRSRYYCSNL